MAVAIEQNVHPAKYGQYARAMVLFTYACLMWFCLMDFCLMACLDGLLEL
jgi:hypothetical protein